MTRYFSDASFRFLRGIARHNEREWYLAHKAEYEEHVRTPFQRLLVDLQPALAALSPHYRADPRPVGGSLYRLRRDTRRYSDKTPYKSWQGAELFYERRHTEAPSFYIHLEPGKSFIAAGIWYPEPATLRKVRQFLLDNPGSWRAAAHAPAFRRRYALDDGQMLTRMPRGFPPEHEFADDLRRKRFVATRPLEDDTMAGPGLLRRIEADLAGMAPFVDYLCAALDLEF